MKDMTPEKATKTYSYFDKTTKQVCTTLQIQLLTVFSHLHKNSKDRRVMVSHTFLLTHVSIKSIIRGAIMDN